MLSEEYLADSIQRGKQSRTLEQRISRLNAYILPTSGDVPVTRWRVEHSRQVMEKGSKTLFPNATARTCASSWRRCASSPGG
ncbi:hypothetical protein ACFQE5_06695 [Pseudonocardia hispaniensis]|uniref:Integrase-like protein n=1 Tax=Pseudonocardia hispaniensis TaxID=904933 RepID=A0ABW1J0A3_9PSEU